MGAASGGLRCRNCQIPNGGHTVQCDREYCRVSVDMLPEDKIPVRTLGGGGRKDDSDKPFAISQVPIKPFVEVYKVFAFGAKKYSARGYTEINKGESRYIDAAHRHLLTYLDGEPLDPESGLHHLAHACCSLLIAMWHGGMK